MEGPDLAAALDAVDLALAEDVGTGDVTTLACLESPAQARATLVARAEGVVCGLPIAALVFGRVPGASSAHLTPILAEGARVRPGDLIARVDGPARAVLSGERTALNFVQRLSGIATLTAGFVEAVAGTGAGIYDTRKTTPGLRRLEKYAVRIGGGMNHRMGLFDQVLIKDNHLAAMGGDVAAALARARAFAPAGTPIEIEVTTEAQFEAAVLAGADIVMLDNMAPQDVARLAGRRPRPPLEASGGITLANVRRYAEAGVERISVGALTHSAPALDVALEFE